ncbi:MAG: Stp1/IreP family PP2C-type Ser/Thr phosphatase [Armatimonadetes bacterium]|nr:Stp1/IreP family PP2C-type Ser/Thr phosphatase [Armatimonadota bacterium]
MSDEKREITAKMNTEELENGWTQMAEGASESATLLLAARTDLGRVRENNEDKFEFFIPSTTRKLSAKGQLIAVADGMGGHAAGQIASELALKTFIASYFSDNSLSVEDALRSAVKEANSLVHETASIPGRSGMGTTLTAAVIRGRTLFVAQVGDSRLYFFRGGRLEQLTQDHSWVAEQVKLGTLSEAEAEESPFRNVITRSLGNQPEVEPDIYKRDVQEADVALLCSDGLSGVVGQGEMERVLSQNGPAESCQELIRMALDRGGPDNITVLIARIEGFQTIEGAAAGETAGSEATAGPGAGEQAQPTLSSDEEATKPQTERKSKKSFLARLRGSD